MQIDVIDPKKTAMIVGRHAKRLRGFGRCIGNACGTCSSAKLADALKICRDAGIKVIYTAHVHRRKRVRYGTLLMTCITDRQSCGVSGWTPGVDIYPELAPAPGEHVIKKHRYSGFFGTDST